MLGSVTSQDCVLAGVYGDDKGSTAPDNLVAHLYEGDPTDDGVEVAATSYAPVTFANTDANLAGPPAGGELGPFTIDFGSVGVGDTWGTPDFWALTDEDGNFFDVQEISNPTSLDDGEPVTVTATITAS